MRANRRIRRVQSNSNPFIELWCRGGMPLIDGKTTTDTLSNQKQTAEEPSQEQTVGKHSDTP